jgi:hypothetical protein
MIDLEEEVAQAIYNSHPTMPMIPWDAASKAIKGWVREQARAALDCIAKYTRALIVTDSAIESELKRSFKG